MAENNSKNKGDDDSYLSDSEICQLSVTGLQNYLRLHQQFISRKKSELIERAKGVKKLGLRDANEQEWEDLEENEVRQEEKLVTQSGERLPDPDTLDIWSDNWLEIPDFYQANIYDYFVLGMKTKRPMRSAVYVDDRHVHSLQYHKVQDNNSHCFVRCKVIKSLHSASTKKDRDHVVWICMAKVSGHVLSADCKCTAGCFTGNIVCNAMRHLPIPSIIFRKLKEASTRQKQKKYVSFHLS